MRAPPYALAPIGDSAISIRLGDGASFETSARVAEIVARLDAAAAADRLPGLVDLVPSYAAVLVIYDVARVSADDVAAALGAILGAQPPAAVTPSPMPAPRPPIEIPVRYHADAAPDLGDVAAHTGLSIDEIVRRHAAPIYRVAMLGFRPGFPYLLGIDPALAVPRLGTPRTRVPAGSVGIAALQTGIYPVPSPGGWRIIGQTALRLFDPARADPFLLHPGDQVRFVPAPP